MLLRFTAALIMLRTAKVLGKKVVPLPFGLPEIPRGLAWYHNQGPVVMKGIYYRLRHGMDQLTVKYLLKTLLFQLEMCEMKGLFNFQHSAIGRSVLQQCILLSVLVLTVCERINLKRPLGNERINENLVSLKLIIKDFWDMTSKIVVHIYKRTLSAF